jgi:hypothetical protein
MKTKMKSGIIWALCLLIVCAGTACSKPANSGNKDLKAIVLVVKHGDESEKSFDIKTEKGTLQEALLDEKLIEGADSSMGMFVTKVDGEDADDSKQQWWCLTKNGEEWVYGVGDTEIEDGDKFEFTLTTGY